LDDDYGLNFDASIMHGARLMIRAPTENDFTKKASLILGRTTVMGICARGGGLWGWLGRGDATPRSIARPSAQHDWTISVWGRRANGYGSVIDGTDLQQAMMGTTWGRADYEAGEVMDRVCNVFFVRDWDMFASLFWDWHCNVYGYCLDNAPHSRLK
jgi:hypothetical protein